MSKTPDSIFDFPQEIIFNILSRLPAKSLLQFRRVCTSAPPLISHPSFIKLHLTSTATDDRRTIILYESFNSSNQLCSLLSPPTYHEPLELQYPSYPSDLEGYPRFAGSNKGLICLFDTDFDSAPGILILWNPSINKYKILDGPHKLSDHSLFVFGFGFVSRTCEFKVVGIVYDYGLNMSNIKRLARCSNPVVDKNNTVLVYLDVSAPCYLDDDWVSTTFVNGFVNWLAFKEDGSCVIMAFDLDTKRFHVFDLPKDIVPNYYSLRMNSFGEEDSLSLTLSLCANYCEYNDNKLDVWVMGEYGVVDSWKKLFVISHSRFPHAPLLMKSDREVLIATDHGRLTSFDPTKNEILQDIDTLGEPGLFRAFNYTASLALLDG